MQLNKEVVVERGGNTANQGIGQSQSSNQNSGVASGGNTVLSGNNLNATKSK